MSSGVMSNFKFLLKKVVKALFEVASFCQKYFINRTKSFNFSVIYSIVFFFLSSMFFFLVKAIFFNDIIYSDSDPLNSGYLLYVGFFHHLEDGVKLSVVEIDLLQKDDDLRNILDVTNTENCEIRHLDHQKAILIFPLKNTVIDSGEFFEFPIQFR